MLDFVDKIVPRIIQERLQQLAQEELTESQCDFWKGQRCSDMVFTIGQLVELSEENVSKSFLVSTI